MKMLRVLFALAAMTAAGYAAYIYCYAPAVCNRVKRIAHTASVRATESYAYDAARMARRTLENLEFCQRACVGDIDILMLAAANQRMVGRADDAIRSYELSLRYAKRPELYLNLGLALSDAGRLDEAVRALTTAATFAPAMVEEITDGRLKAIVEQAVKERDARIRAWSGRRPS